MYNNLINIIFFIYIILFILLFFEFKNYNKIKELNYESFTYKHDSITSGLGDRIGLYLTLSTIAEINNIFIYITWDIKSKWSQNYPIDINNYISFPDNLIFLNHSIYEEFTRNMPNLKLKYKWIEHGFDLVPETFYKSLVLDKIINCNYNTFINIYRNNCRKVKYKMTLPNGWQKRYPMIHLRKGDKGNSPNIEKRLSYWKDIYYNYYWIVTSDDIININSLLNDKFLIQNISWSNNNKIKVLEEFFFYSHSKLIIQNVAGSRTYGGWSSFSYIAFQIGLANYPNSKASLLSCRKNSERTRLTIMNEYANKTLENVIMFPEEIE